MGILYQRSVFTAIEHSFHIKFQYVNQCYSRKRVYCNFVVDGVSQLIAILDSSKVCEGNSKDRHKIDRITK